MTLADGEVHVWPCDYVHISEGLLPTYRTLLTDDERAREGRFHFERDRQRYLVTRVLVRTVLSRYEPVRPEDWRFSVNAHGRPEIANAGRDRRLSFNIAHTHSLIVLGVADGRALGVDVENLRNRDASPEIAERFFAPTEAAALASLPAGRRRDRFYEYWTFKEAYIKARGMGLSIPLDKFSFHYPRNDAVEIVIHPDLADDPGKWQFWQIRFDADYLVAVCADRRDSRSMTVSVKETVPLQGERPCPHAIGRTSP